MPVTRIYDWATRRYIDPDLIYRLVEVTFTEAYKGKVTLREHMFAGMDDKALDEFFYYLSQDLYCTISPEKHGACFREGTYTSFFEEICKVFHNVSRKEFRKGPQDRIPISVLYKLARGFSTPLYGLYPRAEAFTARYRKFRLLPMKDCFNVMRQYGYEYGNDHEVDFYWMNFSIQSVLLLQDKATPIATTMASFMWGWLWLEMWAKKQDPTPLILCLRVVRS